MTLLERSDQLAELAALFDDAEAGRGHLVCVCAEAGGGKSSLVQAFSDSIATRASVLTGWCDPFETPRPAGPLLDMGAALGPTVGQILRNEGRDGLFDAVLAALVADSRPTVLVIEDVHWADGTTLDLLRFLGRRVSTARALVVVTYRDDEIGPAHPLRAVLGDLATQRGIVRLDLPPLSLDAVSELARSSEVDPRRVLAVTGGNPFFVNQVLAAADLDHVPGTVADAVVARLARLPASARRAVTVAAMVGARAEPSLLYDVPGIGPKDLDVAVHAGLVRLTPPVFTFRHELVRQAVLSVTGSAERRTIAAEVLAVLRPRPAEGDALGRLAELAEAADDSAAVREFAPAAGRRAAEFGAHREAAAQYERALRHTQDDAERATLLEKMCVERYLVGQLPEAISAGTAAVDLRRGLGDVARLGDDLRWLARFHWYSGDGATALRLATEALESLEAGGPSPELAMSLSQLSQLHMLAGAYTDAIDRGGLALAMSRELALPDVTAHALNNIGTSLVATGEPAGYEMLRESLEISLAINNEDHAARAYVNITGRLIDERRITEAIPFADESLRYCQSRDLDLQVPYLHSMRAQAAVHAGDWTTAIDEARSVLESSTGTRLHEYVALLPIAVIAVRRGEAVDFEDLARRAGEFDELQRLLPYACLRAEWLWLRGERVPEDSDILAIYARGRASDARHEVTELGVWLGRLGVSVPEDVDASGPMRGALSDPVGTARRLAALGDVFDAAMCLLGGEEEHVREAAETFRRLGAAPPLARAQARLREMGASRIPRGSIRTTASHEWGLTTRQAEVLAVLAEGLSNAEIAARMFLSERTVEHHVSAILTKLGATSRAEAASKHRYQPPQT